MGKTVRDVALLLGAMTGIDADDAVTKESEGRSQADYTKFLDLNALKGKRIGIDKKPQGDNQYLHALQQKSVELIKQLGAEIVELEYLDKMSKLGDAEFLLLQYEFKDGLNKYLAASKAKMKSLTDVIEFNKQNENKAMPFFKQEILEKKFKPKIFDKIKDLQFLKKI